MAKKKDFKKSTAELFISAADTAPEEPQAAKDGFTIPKGYKLTKENKSERMQLLVRPTTKAAIKQAAAAQGVSMNDLINQILDEYTERQGAV